MVIHYLTAATGLGLMAAGFTVGWASDFSLKSFDSGVGGGIFISGLFVTIIGVVALLLV